LPYPFPFTHKTTVDEMAETHPAEIWIPARQAGEGNSDGLGAGGSVVDKLGASVTPKQNTCVGLSWVRTDLFQNRDGIIAALKGRRWEDDPDKAHREGCGLTATTWLPAVAPSGEAEAELEVIEAERGAVALERDRFELAKDKFDYVLELANKVGEGEAKEILRRRLRTAIYEMGTGDDGEGEIRDISRRLLGRGKPQ
jgi:hypothetical protein